MKITLDLSFSVPIWRFFYQCDDKYKIPYEFIYDGKKYTNGICIIQIGRYIKYESFVDKNFFNEISLSNNLLNPIICVPNLKILTMFKKYRPKLTYCMANHNAFIDETVYKIDRTVEQKFDLVVNSSFSAVKNYHLIKNIKNMCAIGYFMVGEQATESTMPSRFAYCPNFEGKTRSIENFKWISPVETCKYYNMSKIGGIFSETEGACFSSSEYLLCGMPVLSCRPDGGREIWYNNDNSIICNPDEKSVIENFKIITDKYDKGEYDREKIRNTHIEQMEVHRNNLTSAVMNLFEKITLDRPTFDDLKHSLKYYHSNCCELFEYPSINYERQIIKQKQAIKVLEL
jgi:glycosyltransferase involved in cell wall biosynthesis